MAKELLPDALWARTAPLLPPEPPKPKGGRPRVSAWTAAHGLCYIRDMTIRKLDHVSVVVDDLAAAIAFLTALDMTVGRRDAGRRPVGWP